MFTGIITDVGEVLQIDRRQDWRFRIKTRYTTASIDLGASISHNGACLTVIETGPNWYDVQVSAETLAKTTLGAWREGQRINLERALKLGDEMGGHLVSGHIDGVARLFSLIAENESWRLEFEVPETLSRFIAAKGSVALDGISLTVNEVVGARFGVNIIPHTQSQTSWSDIKAGDRVNLEIDMLARYVARLITKE